MSMESDSLSLLSQFLGARVCWSILSCSLSSVNLVLDLFITLLIASVSVWHTARISTLQLTNAIMNISKHYSVPDDISSSTILAAATSLPVLISSVITTFLFVSNAGVSIVVGTCIYNLLVCVGLAAIFFGTRLSPLTPRAFIRDSVFYLISVILLVVFLLDEQIVLYESIILVIVSISFLCFSSVFP